MIRQFDAPPQAEPATTLAIIGLIVAVAAVVGCSRLLCGGPRYIRTGAELGAIVLLAAGVISASRAGQKHLAMIGTLDCLGFVVYLLTLRQLLVRPWQIRLALTVVLSTGVVVVTKCAFQYWMEIPNTIAFYEKQKAEGQSTPPQSARDRGRLYDFEQRLKSHSVTGYVGHANVLGSQLILFVLVAVAVLVARRRERRPLWTLAPPGLVILGAAISLGATQSKGAMVACAIGLVVWIVGQTMAGAIARRPKTVFVALGALACLGVGLFLGALRADPARFGRSLQFRSMYWQSARRMIVASDYLGVGAGNFGRHFTRYKPVECPEEVTEPHSWPVRLAAEWGLPGLAGGVLLLLGVAVRLCAGDVENPQGSRGTPWRQRLAGGSPGETPAPQPGGARVTAFPQGSIVLWAAGIGAVVFLWWYALIGGADASFVQITLAVAVVPWFIAFVGLAVERGLSDGIADVAMGPMLPALCAGLLAFVLHTGIDLAMFNAGAATTFFAIVAVALAVRDIAVCEGVGGEPCEVGVGSGRRRVGLVVAVVMAVVLIGYGVLFVGPAARLAATLRSARSTAGSHETWGAYRLSTSYAEYIAGQDAYSFDATAPTELAAQLVARAASVAEVDAVIALADEIRRRDRDDAGVHNLLGGLCYRRYEFGGDVADLRRAVEHLGAFVDAYPTSPPRRLELANVLEALAAITNDAAVARRAAEELKVALDLESRRVYVSQPHRLGADEIEGILARITRLLGDRVD